MAGRVVATRTRPGSSGRPVTVTVRSQARDQIGHWVAPPSERGHPCPHRCCQNKQVHPDALPVKLDRAYLRSLTDEELERELIAYHRYADERTEGYVQVVAEAGPAGGPPGGQGTPVRPAPARDRRVQRRGLPAVARGRERHTGIGHAQ
jgi:hypothetical protein